jgi:hypothetical protein
MPYRTATFVHPYHAKGDPGDLSWSVVLVVILLGCLAATALRLTAPKTEIPTVCPEHTCCSNN